MYPEDPRAGRSRLHRQQITGRRRTGKSQWSYPGTKETDSGKQNASTSHASGEAWQTQVRGVFWGRVREDGRISKYCENKKVKGTRKPITHKGG
ncbi:hypothetical protein NDU88_005851 [Pleurodeles waltl]|uniref:Uncharacterized protein n=1 Tax=Pleurodeles waltl TaxID=8319 RepID=A0AAV7WVV8_PLEWA|nr:hypothetical protein NDU88_005851 [Pleurodeles waltl]